MGGGLRRRVSGGEVAKGEVALPGWVSFSARIAAPFYAATRARSSSGATRDLFNTSTARWVPRLKKGPWGSLAPPLPGVCTGRLRARARARAPSCWAAVVTLFPSAAPPLDCSLSQFLSIYFHGERARGQSRLLSAALRAGG